MDPTPKRSNNLRFNFDLVLAEIVCWPTATLLFLVVMTLEAVLVPDASMEKVSALDKALVHGGALSAMLGLKAQLLLMLYPLLRSPYFPGSYRLVAFISFIPVFPLFIAWSRVSALVFHEPPTPLKNLILGFPFMYVFFSLTFAAFLAVAHTMLLPQRENGSLCSKD
jgi:hypothetical protein